MHAPLATAEDVVAFWREAGPSRWYRKDQAFDRTFRDRFLATHEAAARSELDAWAATAVGALALCILLDQFPRNAFRDSPRMFATFAAVPDTNGASANLVLGAPDFTTQGAGGASQSTLGGPQQVVFAGNKMIVSEYDNDRVVIYNSVPADSSAVPDVVLGQPDFDTDNETCSPDSMVDPETVATTPDGKLVVTDSGNNRVLIWNSVPTQSGTLPDVVLGQGDFTHCMDNDDDQDGVDDSASARTLNGPAGIWTDGQRLVVSDTQNNRVLIWNTFPTSSFTPADVVLGQASMTANAENDDDQDGTADATPTARTLYGPYDGVASNGVQLAIADNNNNRVLVWNTFPTTNFQPADVVLGQGTFQGDTENDDAQTGTPGPLTARVLNRPSGVLFDHDRLIVVDESNNRLLVFKSH